jgi:hypothetical protein
VTLEIRGLTLTQPWATLVALGLKGYETRSWDTGYRGLVAIHAAKKFPRDAQSLSQTDPYINVLNRPPDEYPRGLILCIVRLRHTTLTDHIREKMWGTPEFDFGDFGLGRYAWSLEHVLSLGKPIPCRGMLGLWALPPEALAACETAIGTIARK